MEELKEEYSGLSREEQLELAEKWLAESKIVEEKEYQYLEAAKQVKKAIVIFEKWESWNSYIDARCSLISLFTRTSNTNILSKPTSYLEKTISLSQRLILDNNVHLSLNAEALRYYLHIGQLDKALPYALKRLKLVEEFYMTDFNSLGEAYNDLCSVYNALGEYVLSIQYALKSVQQFEISGNQNKLLIAYNSLGVCYAGYQEYEKSLGAGKKALDVHIKAEGLDTSMMRAMLYNNMAAYYGKIGDYRQQVLYYQKCLKIVSKNLGQAHFRTASVHHNLGAALMNVQQMEKALHHLEKGLIVREQVFSANHPEIALSHQMMGFYYKEIRKYEMALDHTQKSLDIQLETLGENHPDTISSFQNVAIALDFLGRYEEAIEMFEKSVEQAVLFWGTYHIKTADFYKSLSLTYLNANKTPKAVEAILQAENILLHKAKEEKKSSSLGFPYFQLFPIIRSKASTFLQHYHQSTQALDDLKKAVATYEQSVQILDKVRQGYHSEGSKLVWSATESKLYEEGVGAALEMTALGTNVQPTAFRFSEKAKASLLLNSLQTELAKTGGHLPIELLEEEKEMKLKLAYLDKRIQKLQAKQEKKGLNDFETESLKECQDEFFHLHQKYTAFIEQLETNYPDYYQLKYDTKTATPTELQSTLQENQALISYFVGEESIYIFVVTPDEFEVEELEKPDDFEGMIQEFLKSIHSHDQTTYVQLAYELYELLIAPTELHWYNFAEEEENRQQLILIPHAELSYLPFEALISEQADEKTPYQELNYLVQNYEISYHYSATLWQYAQGKKGERADTEHSFVGFAPVYQSENTNIETQEVLTAAANGVRSWATRSEALRSDGTWTPLPHSKEEAENIAALFEGKGLSSEIYLHERATKEEFQKAVGTSRYLLVAAHGVVNDEKTALSGLVFYPNSVEPLSRSSTVVKVLTREEETLSTAESLDNSWNDGESKNDCILSMEETYPLNINADLVVLSSCESGIGKLHKGEGMMAVNRGFLAAGAKNVISTLFKVYDKPSSLLTQYLFEAILEGEEYTAALRKAKLDLMAIEGVSPKSWCGFVLIGG